MVESYCTQEWATLASRPKTWMYIWTIMSHVWMHAPPKYIWTDVTGHKFHLSLDLHVYVHTYIITNMYVLSLYKDTQVCGKYNTHSSMGAGSIKKQKWICWIYHTVILYVRIWVIWHMCMIPCHTYERILSHTCMRS